MSWTYAPVPLHIIDAARDDKPHARSRLLLWTLALARAIEGKPADSVRWLAGIVGCSVGWCHAELRDLAEWVRVEAPAGTREQIVNTARTKREHWYTGLPVTLSDGVNKTRTRREHLVRARSFSQTETEIEINTYGAAGPSGSVEPGHLEAPWTTSISNGACATTSAAVPSAPAAPAAAPPSAPTASCATAAMSAALSSTTTAAPSVPGPATSATPATTPNPIQTSWISPAPSGTEGQDRHTGTETAPGRAQTGGGESVAAETAQAPSRARADVEAVHALWRTWHPLSKSCPPSDATRIRGAVKAHGLDEVILVVEWAHTARDERAAFLRDGGFLAVEALLRASKLSGRIELATAWNMAGKPTQRSEQTTATNRRPTQQTVKLDQMSKLREMAGGTNHVHIIEGECTQAGSGAGGRVAGGHDAGRRRLLAGATG